MLKLPSSNEFCGWQEELNADLLMNADFRRFRVFSLGIIYHSSMI